MGVIVDLIIIAIVLLFIIVGYKKGLTGSLIKLLSFAIAVVLALILYKPVANTIIQRTQIDENLENAIITTFRSQENNQIKQEKKQSNMPETIVNNINTQIDEATAEAKNAIVENNNIEDTTENEVNNTEENAEVETSVPVADDNTYFTTSKLERENMYSQMLETYQKIYNNTETRLWKNLL